jgi:hypothetical protein
MPALVAGIHVYGLSVDEDVDGRDKSGHDGFGFGAYSSVKQRVTRLSVLAVRAHPRHRQAPPARCEGTERRMALFLFHAGANKPAQFAQT